MIEFELINKSIEATSTEDNILHIKGIANTGLKDLEGDTLTREALEDVCTQAMNHNLHIDHDNTMNGVLGPITKAELTDEGVEIHADVLEGPHTARLKTLLDHGVKLGMSVRGFGKRAISKAGDFGRVVLTEVSITPIPADQGTMGSVMIVKSFGELATKMANDNNNNETEDNSMAEENGIGEERIIELINEAFNDRREEFLETIRGELKTEYGVALNELKERIETFESKFEEGEEDGGEAGEGGEGQGEGEGNGEDDIKKSLEDFQKSLDTMKEDITTMVDTKIEEIFKSHKSEDLTFQYDGGEGENGEGEGEEIKKAFTPRELAELYYKQ